MVEKLAPNELAAQIEAAQKQSEDPSKTGLSKLQQEFLSTVPAGQSDARLPVVLEKLQKDHTLSGIVDQWAIDRFDGLITKQRAKDARAGAVNELDRSLADEFIKRFDVIADTSVGSGFLWRHKEPAVSTRFLTEDKARQNASVLEFYAVDLLKTSSPDAHPLWSLIEERSNRVDANGRHYPCITKDGLVALEREGDQLKLTDAQKTAVGWLSKNWDSVPMNALRDTVTVKEFVPFNPLDRVDPFYGLNPANQIQPWNYRNVTRSADYITHDSIKRTLGISLE